MENPSLVEPESLLEVRRWKDAAGEKLRMCGFIEFDRQAREEYADLLAQVAKTQKMRLVSPGRP
jgi:hypothetical protein